MARKQTAARGPTASGASARRLPVVALLAVLACKARDGSTSPSLPPPAPSKACADSRAADAENTITGAVGGVAFTDIATAFVIESPDLDTTTVIYLLSKPARCLDLSFSEWDRLIATGTSVLELKLVGHAPGSFLAVTTPTLSPREAAAEWMRISAKGVANEVRSSGGRILLDSISPRGPATGSFALAFGGGQLTGRFNAAFCPNGYEP
jgi:hypothetical protein